MSVSLGPEITAMNIQINASAKAPIKLAMEELHPKCTKILRELGEKPQNSFGSCLAYALRDEATRLVWEKEDKTIWLRIWTDALIEYRILFRSPAEPISLIRIESVVNSLKLLIENLSNDPMIVWELSIILLIDDKPVSQIGRENLQANPVDESNLSRTSPARVFRRLSSWDAPWPMSLARKLLGQEISPDSNLPLPVID